MNISLKKMLPLLENEQLEELTTVLLETENKQYKDVRLRDVLPFIGDSTIDKVLFTLIERQEEYQYVLPFVSNQTLQQLVEKGIQGEIDIDFDQIYPFLSNEDIGFLFQKAMEKEN